MSTATTPLLLPPLWRRVRLIRDAHGTTAGAMGTVDVSEDDSVSVTFDHPYGSCIMDLDVFHENWEVLPETFSAAQREIMELVHAQRDITPLEAELIGFRVAGGAPYGLHALESLQHMDILERAVGRNGSMKHTERTYRFHPHKAARTDDCHPYEMLDGSPTEEDLIG